MAQAAFGWTQLSERELRRVEEELADESRGVRDELGFLELHSLYADRFFPGTSVLLTRLRYCLFVPWIYQDAVRAGVASVGRYVAEREQGLTRRLIHGVGSEAGIIGRRTYPALPSQPPSSTYWNTLCRWGIVRSLIPGEQATPSRGQVAKFLSASNEPTSRIEDDDKLSVEPPIHRVFAELPSPPEHWEDDEAALTFELTEEGRHFLRGVMTSIRRSDGQRSLMAAIAATELTVAKDTSLFDERIVDAADDADREALRRAAIVADLAMVGRSLYAALVETLRDQRDGMETADVHRQDLAALVATLDSTVLEFDISTVRRDVIASDDALQLLRLVQQFCRAPDDLFALHRPLAEIELRRKGWRRARLPDTPGGRDRRLEWTPSEHPLGAPLHYRWYVVRDLLLDLQRNEGAK